MARYIKQEMADIRGDGNQRTYYRMKVERNIGTREFIRHMTHPGSGLSESMAIHVIEALGEQLARDLAEGYSVTIDGLGIFTATVGLDKRSRKATDGADAKYNARNLTVDGVRYKADKGLVTDIALQCDLRKGGESHLRRSPYSREERKQMALEYLADPAHPMMRLADYALLTHLSRSAASRELRELCMEEDSPLKASGRLSSMVIIRRV